MWLITHWKTITICTLSLILLVSGFWIKSLDRDIDQLKASLDMANANYSQCKTDIKKRDEISEDYQNNLSDLNKRLNDERMRRKSAKCIPIIRESRPIKKVS